MAGRGAFWISWDGMMYSCGMLSHEGTSVREFAFDEAWSRTVESARKLYIPAECSVCKYRKLCPSCAAVSQCINQEQGKLVPDLCTRTQAYVEEFRKLVAEEQLNT
jgi:radical SAM protein with 4Fe4S-binding SPASM domain